MLPVEQPRPKARGECPQAAAAAAGVANRRMNAIKHPNPPNSIFKDAFTTLAQPSKLGIVALYSLLLTAFFSDSWLEVHHQDCVKPNVENSSFGLCPTFYLSVYPTIKVVMYLFTHSIIMYY